MKWQISTVLAVLCACALPKDGRAVESGVETYLLGSRGSMAGVLPPPGTYLNNDFVFFSGSAPNLLAGGKELLRPNLDVKMYKFNLTHVFKEPVGNARFGLNINIPYIAANMDFSVGSLTAETDSEYAFSDIMIAPLFNWTKDKLSTTLALQFFLPTGHYSDKSVNSTTRSADVLNSGKNRFAFDPTVSMTWFDPQTGWEFSGALGVTISKRNTTTDYQTAPEAHFEGAVMRHFANRLGLGMTGYAYQQIGDDSGSGADNFEAMTGASSLQARVFGLGPIVSWNTKIGKTPITFMAKYITEFGAQRRFESDKLWMTVGVAF